MNYKAGIYLTGFAIMAMVLGSCSKSDEKQPEPENVVQLTPGMHTDTILVNNVKRPFLYYIPLNLPDSCAVVFEFHGSSAHHSESNPNKINDILSSGTLTEFFKKADQINKYVYVYPKGEELPLENGIHWANDVNVAFFDKLREYILKGYPKISKRKVYCCGHSSGAIFALRLAFTRPQQVAAAVSISGQYSFKNSSPIPSNNPVPIMQVNGKVDVRVAYEEALANARKAASILNKGGEELLIKDMPFGEVANPVDAYVVDKYTWKDAKADYIFYGINNEGHNVSWQKIMPEIWKFMEAHPRK